MELLAKDQVKIRAFEYYPKSPSKAAQPPQRGQKKNLFTPRGTEKIAKYRVLRRWQDAEINSA